MIDLQLIAEIVGGIGAVGETAWLVKSHLYIRQLRNVISDMHKMMGHEAERLEVEREHWRERLARPPEL